MFEKLLEMKKEGTLAAMVAAGLMSVKVHMYIEIYMYINAKMTVNKKLKKTQAVRDCCEVMDLKEDTVWRALRIMSSQITAADNTMK